MRRPGALASWLLALVAGLTVAFAAGALVRPAGAELPPAGDRVRAAIDGLKRDRFYVAPEMRNRLTAEQRRTISAALADGRVSTYLIFWKQTSDAGYYLDSQALDQVIAGVGVDGRYASVDQLLNATYESRGMGYTFVDPDVLVARADQALLAYARAMGAEPAEPVDRSDYWGGPGGGIAAGALFAGGGFLVLLCVIGFVGLLLTRPERHLP